MEVNVKVYTKAGDTGKTSLLNERVSKTNLHIEVNGQIDELMVLLAFLIEDLKTNEDEKLYNQIRQIYKTLFTITSIVADAKNFYDYNIHDKEIEKLEKEMS